MDIKLPVPKHVEISIVVTNPIAIIDSEIIAPLMVMNLIIVFDLTFHHIHRFCHPQSPTCPHTLIISFFFTTPNHLFFLILIFSETCLSNDKRCNKNYGSYG
jgi:hypothetical protein